MNDKTYFCFTEKTKWFCNNGLFNFLVMNQCNVDNEKIEYIKEKVFNRYPVLIIKPTNIYPLKEILFNYFDILPERAKKETYKEIFKEEMADGLNYINILTYYNESIDINIYLL